MYPGGGDLHISLGSDPGDRDERFNGTGGSNGGGWLVLVLIIIVAFIAGLILMKIYLPFWVGYIVLSVIFCTLAVILFSVFRKGSEQR